MKILSAPFLSQEDVDEVGEAVMRPREGDLVFFPLGGRLFEIKIRRNMKYRFTS